MKTWNKVRACLTTQSLLCKPVQGHFCIFWAADNKLGTHHRPENFTATGVSCFAVFTVCPVPPSILIELSRWAVNHQRARTTH